MFVIVRHTVHKRKASQSLERAWGVDMGAAALLCQSHITSHFCFRFMLPEWEVETFGVRANYHRIPRPQLSSVPAHRMLLSNGRCPCSESRCLTPNIIPMVVAHPSHHSAHPCRCSCGSPTLRNTTVARNAVSLLSSRCLLAATAHYCGMCPPHGSHPGPSG